MDHGSSIHCVFKRQYTLSAECDVCCRVQPTTGTNSLIASESKISGPPQVCSCFEEVEKVMKVQG